MALPAVIGTIRAAPKMLLLSHYGVAGVDLGMLIALSGNSASSTPPRLVPKQKPRFWV
jgi:hypothetical protein